MRSVDEVAAAAVEFQRVVQLAGADVGGDVLDEHAVHVLLPFLIDLVVSLLLSKHKWQLLSHT